MASTYPVLDVLAMAAHPDDVELCAGGTICAMTGMGYKVGVVDFTRGELGSRGSVEQRLEEARAAASIMGLSARENLAIPDGQIMNSKDNRAKVIRVLRRFRPKIMLVNAPVCRHPDHCDASTLATSAAFYSGLSKVLTKDDNGTVQTPWRPHHILHYMQSTAFEPTLVVDVSDVWDQRMKALQAFSSQFYNPAYEAAEDEPSTYVSNPAFYHWIEARARTYGYPVGATYGEPFLYFNGPFGVTDLVDALSLERPFR